MHDELLLTKAHERYADEIASYRQAFLESGDHMDGCGSLRKYENVHEYIENCRQREQETASAESGGHAQQFLCIRKADGHLVGMIQYRYDADPRFQTGYSVRPCERGKGYAGWMLRQLLLWLRRQGKTELTVSCEPSNPASEHVIISCGGRPSGTCTYRGIELHVWKIPLQ